MTLNLYNSLSQKKEPFTSKQDNRVSLYTCGPTVYNFAHIGNFRTYVFEDILRRTLQWFNFKVCQVMNLTDVDDKTIRGAILEKLSLDDFTQKYKKAFFEDLALLNIERAEHYPEATVYIPKMIEMIQILMDKGFAYVGEDKSIYFRIHSFSSYGALSHFKLSDLKSGASGVVADEYDKESVSDFVLWKSYDPARDGPIYWESPFGLGRPGWHIECSAMSLALLGDQKPIDIHCGGEDNKFPHHENEIAQSECCTGHQFVRFWMHSAHLLVDGKKMSKSAGNFYTLRDLLDRGFKGNQVRLALLQTHYRSPLNFTFESLEAAKGAIARIFDFKARMQEISISDQKERSNYDPTAFLQKAGEAIGDDLNTSLFLGLFFEEIRMLNKLADDKKLSSSDAEKALFMIDKIDTILGCFSVEEEEIPSEVKDAAFERVDARRARDFARADKARDLIASLGWIIEDTKDGFRLKKR